ncbi:hypothetical protein, partial [Pseudomonas viridiflava]|uniref:hypothetical protein n=1 Tax=Pseudomonas viridiflava TaxID=33069 RepID=UPI00311A9A53
MDGYAAGFLTGVIRDGDQFGERAFLFINHFFFCLKFGPILDAWIPFGASEASFPIHPHCHPNLPSIW